MKATLLACIMLACCTFSKAQPEIDYWIMSTGLATYDDGSGIVTMADSNAVQRVCYNSNFVWVITDGIPPWSIGPWSNPNVPVGQDAVYEIPRNPTEETGAKTALSGGCGGVTLDGACVFKYGDGRSYNTSTGLNENSGDGVWNQDAWYSEATTMDAAAQGHNNAGGIYHYHAEPIALYDENDSSVHSPIIGFAADGFPIYGPFGYDNPMNATSPVTRMRSGYSLRNITVRTTLPDGSPAPSNGPNVSASFPLGNYIEDYEWLVTNGHLDEYNGRTCVTPEYPGGTYAYFVTVDASHDPFFPYMLAGEYYGEVDNQHIGPTAGSGTVQPGSTCFTEHSTFVFEFDAADIAIYPNPIQEGQSIQVETTYPIDRIQVMDMNGRALLSETLTQQYSYQFDISALESGLYLMSIEIDGKRAVKKLVVN